MTPRSRARAAALALVGVAPVFAALGDQLRLRLVARLAAAGPLSIKRLTAGTRVSRQAVTRHLHVLAEVGLAQGVVQGREVIWELRPEPMDEVRRSLDLISRRWDESLGRLKAALEE